MDTRNAMALLACIQAWEDGLAQVASHTGHPPRMMVRLLVQRQGGPYARDVAHVDIEIQACDSAHALLRAKDAQAHAQALLSPLGESFGRMLRAQLPVLTGPNGSLGAAWSLKPGNPPVLAGDFLSVNNAYLPLYEAPLHTVLPLMVFHLGRFRPTSSTLHVATSDGIGTIGAANPHEAIEFASALFAISAALLPTSQDTPQRKEARLPAQR